MVSDLHLELELVVVSTVRDADGLALSSRNVRLSPEERTRALALPRALSTRDPASARAILAAAGLDVDYVEVAAFTPHTRRRRPCRLDPADRQRPTGGGIVSTRPRTPAPNTPAPGKLPITELAELKARRQPIVMVTAYDAPSGRLADKAGVDLILVGDSAGMACSGTTRPSPRRWTRCRAHARGDARVTAARSWSRTCPSGRSRSPTPRRWERDPVRQGSRRRRRQARGRRAVALAGRGDRRGGHPVMGHIGLTPQSATALGGFKAQAAPPSRRAASSTTRARSRQPAASRRARGRPGAGRARRSRRG